MKVKIVFTQRTDCTLIATLLLLPFLVFY